MSDGSQITETQERHAGAAGQTPGDACPSTLGERMPTLDALFAKMADGKMPNFLEVLAALSEMTEFNTDCDGCPTC